MYFSIMTSRTTITTSKFLEESSDEDSDLDEELNAPPTFSQQSQSSPSTSQKAEASPTVTPPANDEQAIEDKAQRKAKFLSLSIANDISSLSELYWHRQKKTAPPYPVRICPESEKIMVPGLKKDSWDTNKKVLVQYLGQYDDRNEHAVVLKSQLVPYHNHDGNNNASSSWCPNNTREFIQDISKRKKGGKNRYSPVELRLEELYLEKLLERIVENMEARQTAAQHNNDDEEEEVASDYNEFNNNDNTTSATAATSSKTTPRCRVTKSLNGQPDNKNHKLRAGDVIEYTCPQFVQDRQEGYRCTTILSIQKNQPYPLILQNGELLPSDHLIRRIQRLVRNKLVEYNGKIKSIYDHYLQYDNNQVSVVDGLQKEAQRVGDIIDKNMEKHRAGLQESGIPLDILQNIQGGRKQKAVNDKENVQETTKDNVGSDDKMEAVDSGEANQENVANDGDGTGEGTTDEPSNANGEATVSSNAMSEASTSGSKKRAERDGESPVSIRRVKARTEE